MRLGLLLLVSLAAACTRDNPAFEGGDDPEDPSTSGPGSTGRTSEPDDGPASSTGASSTGDGADTTSLGATTAGPESSTGPVGGSTEECPQVTVEIPLVRDAFIQRGICNGGGDCQSLNTGASASGVIEGVSAELESYLLMSFELGERDLPDPPLSATLNLHVGHAAAMTLEVSQVFPLEWSEGSGLATPAASEEAAWPWSSSPDPWVTPGASGTFEVVLDGALVLGSAEVGMAMGSHPQDIMLDDAENEIDQWPGSSVIHLAVTRVGGEGPVVAFTRESGVSPTLMITGC